MPGHKGVAGNKRAHQAAQEMTATHHMPGVDLKRQVREHSEASKLLQTALEADISQAAAKWGHYTHSIDSALPGKHTLLLLYGALTREDAGILAQARTGHTHLRDCLARTQWVESAVRECKSGIESVKHVILQCPLWSVAATVDPPKGVEEWVEKSYVVKACVASSVVCGQMQVLSYLRKDYRTNHLKQVFCT